MSSIIRKINVFNKFFWSVAGGVCILAGITMVLTGDVGSGIGTVIIGAITVWFTRWLFSRLLSEASDKEANPGPPVGSPPYQTCPSPR